VINIRERVEQRRVGAIRFGNKELRDAVVVESLVLTIRVQGSECAFPSVVHKKNIEQ
jgi:hypothetical protein